MFFICLVPYIHISPYYFLILCSYFHFFSYLAKRFILQFTMFDDFITTCPFITEIKRHSRTKTDTMIIIGTKYEFFLLPYQITCFLPLGQAKILFSYHILMKVLIYILFCDKKSLNNIPYRKLSLNCKKYFKIRKNTCFNKM